MRKIIRYGPLILLLLAPGVADAQQAVTTYPAPWSQVGNTVSLAVTNSTGNVKLGWASVTPAPNPPPPALRVCNTGTVAASVAVGGSSITVVATTGIPVSAGACSLIALNGATYVAAITASSTTTITAQTGTGTPYAGDSRGTGVLTGYAIGSLPSGTIGMLAYVTDQLGGCPVIGAGPTPGGAGKCRVWYNGSAWVGD